MLQVYYDDFTIYFPVGGLDVKTNRLSVII